MSQSRSRVQRYLQPLLYPYLLYLETPPPLLSQALQMAADMQNRASRRPQGRLIGYARVSTDEQATEAQEMELRAAGCETIVQEHGSGASRARPALSRLLRDISSGDILGYVTPRTNGTAGGNFLIAGPGWNGRVPDGIDGVFRSPTELVLAHYRTQLLGPDDLPRVHAIQDGYSVRPLSAYTGTVPPPAAAPVEPVAPLDVRKHPFDMQFFCVLNWMLEFMPPLPDEVGMRERFATIGIGAGREFAPDTATRIAIEKGMQEALAEMQARAGQVRSSAELFGSREFLGQDYLTRAVATMIGIYGNAAEEYLGVGYQTDSEGRPFDGANRYTITFPEGGLPDVGAFWSITAYDADRFVYANEIDRYSVNSMMVPNFVRNADGSITIYVQHDRPDVALVPNWLPVPDTPFGLTFRTYQPGAAIRDGSWQAPPVLRVTP